MCMCHENHQLACKCCQLKRAQKMHSTWFYNTTLHIELLENVPIHKIFHLTDIEKVLGVDNLDEYVNNISFQKIFINFNINFLIYTFQYTLFNINFLM